MQHNINQSGFAVFYDLSICHLFFCKKNLTVGFHCDIICVRFCFVFVCSYFSGEL